MLPHKLTRALVREPSPRYAAFYAPHGIIIRDDLMLQQHRAYVDALRLAGLHVDVLPPCPRHHDCVFIEDTAIIWNGAAMITRMNPRRQGEQEDVAQWLRQHFEIVTAPEAAAIEGGDVLHLDDVTLVGRSERTNEAGIEALRAFMRPHGHEVIAIPVERCLHLKSAMTYLGDRTVLVSPGLIDSDLPQGYQRLEVPSDETHAGNVLRINSAVLHPACFPQTAETLDKFAAMRGLRLIELDISEAQKGDGALTCQSLLW